MHARNLCGIADAAHAEYNTRGTHIVTLLSCSLRDNLIEVELWAGSSLQRLYGTSVADECTTCNYGLEPAFAHLASEQGCEPQFSRRAT